MMQPVLTNTSPELAGSWIAVAHSAELTDRPMQVWVLGEQWVIQRVGAALHALGRRDWRRPAGVAEHIGLIWLAVDEPLAPMPSLTGWGRRDFVAATCATVRTPVSAVQLIDNFMDAAHFPFVHATSFGVADAFEVSTGDVARDGWQVCSTFTAPYQNHDDPLVASGEHELVQEHTVTKIGYAGCNASLELRFPVTGGVFGIAYACQPETAASTRIFKVMARNDVDAAGMQRCVSDEDAILREDLDILERYSVMGVETDLTVEVHTRADRLSVAWRRLMRDMARHASTDSSDSADSADSVALNTGEATATTTDDYSKELAS